MLGYFEPNCDLFCKEPWLLLHPKQVGWMGQRRGVNLRQLDGNMILQCKDSTV